MENRKIYQMLGLCQKARGLVHGEFAARKAVLEEAAQLVIIAEDAGKNTKKLFQDKAAYRKIECIEWGTKEELGQAIGREPRAVIAVTDVNFAAKISQMIRNR